MNSIRHRRLHNQHLLKSTFKDPVDVLKTLVAVQAQDFHGAKWALGQRTFGSTDEKIEKAFNEGRILRLHVMRPTWHFVTPDDIRWLVELTAPRVNTISSHYFRKTELDDKVFRRTNRVLTKVLEDGRHLTRSELRAQIVRAGIEPGNSMRFGYIILRAELDALVCSGPRKGNQFTYALLAERAPRSKTLSRDEALGELARRYFTTRGPATMQDYVWWSGLTIAQATRGLEIAGNTLKSESFDDTTYWGSAATLRGPKGEIRRVHLLPVFDEYLIAYKDRTAALNPKIKQENLETKSIFEGPLLIDGYVAGGWKRVLAQKSVTIQLRTFTNLTRSTRAELIAAAEAYARFLDREPIIEFVT